MQRFVAFLLMALLAFAAPARATITSSANTVTIAGNGSQTVFSFAFVGVAASDIVVILTTSTGAQSTLVQGPGTTQFQVSINAAVAPSLWGVGGTVTYNPSGVAVPAGSTLTITRTLPFTQTTSLQNQASFGQYASATETAIDQLAMQVQQLNTSIGYAIQANPANSAAPAVLPPAAQIAGLGICADGTGLNLIGCSLAPAGTISSAMAPVVGAASLSAGRTAFGLGTMALENINAGSCGGPSIQDDGSGNARVVQPVVADAINTAVTCNFHSTYRVASGPLTYTLSRASTNYFNGFYFFFYSAVGVTTITPNAADNFLGMGSGVSIGIPQGIGCFITTSAAGAATWITNCTSPQPSLAATVGSSALTLTLYAPTMNFRDSTLANGDSFTAVPTGGLSITVPSGATLGTSSSNVPFRVWVFIAYNGGTPVLGVATCSISTAVYPCAAWETIQKSGTGITSGSTSAGTLYTSSAVTNDAVRIIGYADYASGLATAGTWASTPTTLQVCMGRLVCKRPGDQIQANLCSSTTAGTTTSATFAAFSNPLTCAITPTSTPNLVRIRAEGTIGGSGGAWFWQMVRGSTAIANPKSGTVSLTYPINNSTIDAPGSTSAQTYGFQGKAASGTLTFPVANTGATLELWEIMGALDPENDNEIDALRRTG